MFQRLIDHIAKWHAAQQRSENHLLWGEVERLRCLLVKRDCQMEDLKKENAWLQHCLDMTVAELQEVGNHTARPTP